MKMNDETFLKHFGIMGMRWGRSGGRSSGGTGKGSSKKKKDNSSDHNTSSKINTKKRSSLSNADLKKANERMQLEQTHKRLKAESAPAGKKFIKSMIATTGKEMASAYLKKYATKGLDKTASIILNQFGG